MTTTAKRPTHWCSACRTTHTGVGCPRRRRTAEKRRAASRDDKAFFNSDRWQRLRAACLVRDYYVCQACGKPAGESAHADHKLPRETHPGLAWDLDNLQTLCVRCHTKKTNRETAATK